jgi:hypothetical protein
MKIPLWLQPWKVQRNRDVEKTPTLDGMVADLLAAAGFREGTLKQADAKWRDDALVVTLTFKAEDD